MRDLRWRVRIGLGLGLVGFGLVTGCGGLGRPSAPPIAYTMRHFERTLQDCPEHLAPCASIELDFPEIESAASPEARAAIEAFIDTTVLASVAEGDTTTAQTDPDVLMAQFLGGYQEFVARFPDAPGEWTLRRAAHPLLNKDACFSLEVSEESYTGGAHPNTTVWLASFDTRNGLRIQLDDLFEPGYRAALRALGERAFRDARGLAPADDLVASGFWFENDQFALNDNFAVTEDGLRFYFNSYEVAPYAMGPTEFTLTREALAGLVRSDGPLRVPKKT